MIKKISVYAHFANEVNVLVSGNYNNETNVLDNIKFGPAGQAHSIQNEDGLNLLKAVSTIGLETGHLDNLNQSHFEFEIEDGGMDLLADVDNRSMSEVAEYAILKEKLFNLIDHNNNIVDNVSFHGKSYRVIDVLNDTIIINGPIGEDSIDILELLDQDEMVKGIVSVDNSKIDIVNALKSKEIYIRGLINSVTNEALVPELIDISNILKESRETIENQNETLEQTRNAIDRLMNNVDIEKDVERVLCDLGYWEETNNDEIDDFDR